jgi:glycosyltransferase involved in cell wall biosynthesis
MSPRFELVLPCYNEAKSLPALVQRASSSAEAFGFKPGEFTLVLVNNGSTDQSAEVFSQLKSSAFSQWFREVSVPVNQGYGHGIWTGLQSTTAPIVGWSHADQQCDPENAFSAYQILKESSAPRCLVKGVRFGRNWKDQFVSRVFEFFARVILGLKIQELNAQPKVFHRELLALMKEPPKTFAFDLYALYHAQKANYEIKTLDVPFPPRVHGASKWAAHFLTRYKTIAGMIVFMTSLMRKEGRL